MWIYTWKGSLVNLDNYCNVGEGPYGCYAYDIAGDQNILSTDPADISRIYSALNAGVAVLDLRGEQHG